MSDNNTFKSSALPDLAHRELIKSEISKNIFVEAAAGSGKTTILVDRIITMILSGIKIDNIVAITFTNKSGAELKTRLSAKLLEEIKSKNLDVLKDAYRDIDQAMIGTIHSFCLILLKQYSSSIGLPPTISVLNDYQQNTILSKMKQDILYDLLSEKDTQTVLIFVKYIYSNQVYNIKTNDLLDLIELLYNKYSVIKTNIYNGNDVIIKNINEKVLKYEFNVFCNKLKSLDFAKLPNKDKYKIIEMNEYIKKYVSSDPDLETILSFDYTKISTVKTGLGKGPWAKHINEVFVNNPDEPATPDTVNYLKNRHSTIIFNNFISDLIDILTEKINEKTLTGKLSFGEIISLTMDFVREKITPEIKKDIESKYKYFLIDEFQDTDSDQLEIFLRLLSPDIKESFDIQSPNIPDGSLFVVGDPKQAIYHFRGGDLEVYKDVRDNFVTRFNGINPKKSNLTVNFRSADKILDAANNIFGNALGDDYTKFEYKGRNFNVPKEKSFNPELVVISPNQIDSDKLKAYQKRIIEANDIAKYIKTSGIDYSDFAIVCPTKNIIPYLKNALSKSEIPYIVEIKSEVYDDMLVNSLMNLIKALSKKFKPIDTFTLFTLRSPFFGISDKQLYEYKKFVNSEFPDIDYPFDYTIFETIKDSLASNEDLKFVYEAFEYLTELDLYKDTHSLSDLVTKILDDRGIYQIDINSVLTFKRVLNDIYEYEKSVNLPLENYIYYIENLKNSTMNKEVIINDDAFNAVTITNFHQSKGREWPYVIIAAANQQYQAKPRSSSVELIDTHSKLFDTDNDFELKLGKNISTKFYDKAAEIENQICLAEQIRTYYVGYTRAKYGLIITAHSFSSDKNNTFFNVLEGSGFLDNSDYSSVDSTLNMIAYDDKFDKKIKTLYSNRFDNIYRSEICKKSLEKSTFTVSKHEYSIDDIDGIQSQKNQLDNYINSLNDTDLPTMDAAAFGTIIHSILEKSRLQYDEELIELAGTDLTKKDQELAKKIISNLIMNSTTINEAIKSKKVYQELSMGASREFTSESKTTQAYADLVYLGDDGLWTIADYKNVSVADSLPEYKQQLLIYKDIFEKATGEKVSKIVLIYTFGDSLELVWNF